MKTTTFAALTALSLLPFSSVFAQAGSVSVASNAPQATAVATPQPNQIVYKAQLPTAQELTNAAASQGLTVETIDQTSDRITAVYKLANGQTNTVAYTLLPSAGAAGGTALTTAPAGVPAAVAYTTAPSTVVYASPGPYYYDPLYGPWYGYGYPVVGLGIGFGYHGGFYHGYGHWHR